MALSSSLDGALRDPQVRSFFRAIKENPDDDTPRLIFADWLQECGDAAASARGEFLRLNVLRHRLSPDDPHHDALKRREAEIVKQYQWAWLGPLADAACWTYQRGMIQLTARAEKILTTEIADWSRTEAALWIDALKLTEMALWSESGDRSSSYFFYRQLLRHLNRLDLSSNHLCRYLRLVVGADERAPYLTELVLASNHLTATQIPYLTKHPLSRRLTLLDLGDNRLDDAAARLLSETPHLKNLTSLHLAGNRFTAEGMALLRDAFGERVQL